MARKKVVAEMPPVKKVETAARYQRRIAACLRVMRNQKAKMEKAKADFDAKNALAAALSEQVYLFAESERNKLAVDGKKPAKVLIGNAGSVEWVPTQRAIVQAGFTEAQVVAQCEDKGKLDFVRYTDPELNRRAIHEDPAGLDEIMGIDIDDLEIVKVRPKGKDVADCMERDPEKSGWAYKPPGKSKAGATAPPQLLAAE